MYKINKFIQFIADGDFTILFNLQKNNFIVLRKELAEIVKNHRNNVNALKDIHPELYLQMEKNGMIIPEETNEVAQIIKNWEAADNSQNYFSMIINPTLNCNLKCWYCYEEHDRKPIMNAEIVESICYLIKKKTATETLKDLNISFFGGEPLLGFEKVIKPILSFAAEECRERGINMSSNFTTNGTLLTEEIFLFLKKLNLTNRINFQISLDGNNLYHNNIRIGHHREPTYHTIIKNIKESITHEFSVSVRLNYTAENILTFIDVLEDFRDISETERKLLSFNFQQIWQDQAINKDIQQRVEKVKNIFTDEGFFVSSDKIHHRHNCYADMEHNIVINYDGNLFKCTARDFKPEDREGCLTKDGELLWNNKFRQRMAIKYSNKACLACNILPICNGGCTQNKLEAHDTNTCYRHMSDLDKEEYIKKRLEELIMMHNKKNS